MKFSVVKSAGASQKCDILCIPCFEKKTNHLIKTLDKLMRGELSKQIDVEKFTAKKDSSLCLFTAATLPARYVLLVGLGTNANDFSVLRVFGATCAREAVKVHALHLSIAVDEIAKSIPPEKIARLVTEGLVLGSYNFDKYKTSKEDKDAQIESVAFICNGLSKKIAGEIETGRIIAGCVCMARDLTNTPGCDATPRILASVAHKLAKENHLSCRVMNEDEIRKEQMNCLLAIAQGSSEPPTFIRLDYKPKGAKKHIVIVGKGVTFDAGGISLKPSKGMGDMKSDMAGGAVVLAVITAISKLKLKVAVTGLIPATENLPDGRALKPADIIVAKNGKTIEVTNTDAEGRLILADALVYASELKPDAIIDLATLTGGADYCCGDLYSLVMGNDRKLVDGIITASKSAGEYMWELPIVEEYRKGYTSGIADLNNTGKTKAQTISGAIFLREFVKDTKWAHVDIAASSFLEEDTALSPKGATGAMVRTLIEFLARS